MAELKGLDKARKSELLFQYTLANSGYRKDDKEVIMQQVMTLLRQAGTENNIDCDKLTRAAGMTESLIEINREQWTKILAEARQDLQEVKNSQ